MLVVINESNALVTRTGTRLHSAVYRLTSLTHISHECYTEVVVLSKG